jgi:hypothetical protein
MLTLLPKSYKGLVVTLTYGKTSITSSKVQTALLSYDQREKKIAQEAASAGASDGQGLMVRNNHGGKSGKKKKGKPQCFNCKEWGHIRKNYPTTTRLMEPQTLMLTLQLILIVK